jgi:hypothetical protein
MGCAKTGFVIPRRARIEEGKEVVTFWRVLIECPLEDTEVLKSENKAPETYWVTITPPNPCGTVMPDTIEHCGE